MTYPIKVPALAAATAFLASPAMAQSLDEQVNAIFASSTGWFVNLIFAPLPGTAFPWIVLWLPSLA